MRIATRLIATSMILASAHAGADVQASLRTDVIVAGPRVTLGDVVMFGGGDKVSEEALATIDLGSTPLPGYTARFTRMEIERMVRARTQGNRVVWGGADTVRVERAATTFDSAQIGESAGAYLREILRGEADRVELQLSGPLPDLKLPTGKIELKPRPIQSSQAMHRRVTVWVDILIEGAFFRSVTVPFEVRAYRPVLVAKRDLPKGIAPQCDALQLRETDVAGLDSPPFSEDCHALDGYLKRSLPQGTPLLKSYLQASIPVMLGDNVSLQMIDGSVILESRAIALGDGEVGQHINVKPSGGTEAIAAEVVAPGIVRITRK
jgi:flagella basal body P-ring formation protein FlgA